MKKTSKHLFYDKKFNFFFLKFMVHVCLVSRNLHSHMISSKQTNVLCSNKNCLHNKYYDDRIHSSSNSRNYLIEPRKWHIKYISKYLTHGHCQTTNKTHKTRKRVVLYVKFITRLSVAYRTREFLLIIQIYIIQNTHTENSKSKQNKHSKNKTFYVI